MLLDRYVEKDGTRCEDMNMDIQRKREKNKKAYKHSYKINCIGQNACFFLMILDSDPLTLYKYNMLLYCIVQMLQSKSSQVIHL